MEEGKLQEVAKANRVKSMRGAYLELFKHLLCSWRVIDVWSNALLDELCQNWDFGGFRYGRVWILHLGIHSHGTTPMITSQQFLHFFALLQHAGPRQTGAARVVVNPQHL